MEAFDFSLPTHIVFGKERYDEAGALCAAIGKKVLLHYGGGSIKKNGLYDRIMASLSFCSYTCITSRANCTKRAGLLCDT